MIPIFGIIAIAIGAILTITSLRRSNDAGPISQVNPPSVSNSNNSHGNSIPQDSNKNAPANRAVNTTSSNKALSTPANKVAPESETLTDDPSSAISDGTQPSATPSPEIVRYASGKNLISPQSTGGRGTFLISNGTSSDAIAKLVDATTNKTIRLVYIQSDSKFTIPNIRVGRYLLKFSLGNGYIAEQSKFQNNQSYSQFDETFNFGEYRNGNRIEWDNFTVTLNKVLNGNAPTSPIGEADFEDH